MDPPRPRTPACPPQTIPKEISRRTTTATPEYYSPCLDPWEEAEREDEEIIKEH
jgi:hypothetical protein